MRLPVELGHVEVDRENERERDEGGHREERLSGDMAERRKESRVNEKIGQGVEIPANESDPTGGARELSVQVVEERLQLQEHCRGDQDASGDGERGDDPDRCIREHDGGRRQSRPLEKRYEQVRQRPKDGFEEELATGAGCNDLLGATCQPVATGLCVDPSSSQNDGTPSSERFTEGNEMEFAIEDPAAPGHYQSLATLRTNKFINTAARTVRRFAVGSSGPADYAPGTGTLLVWGRPHFSAEQGRQAQIYLMVHRLPIRLAKNGRWRFRPRFYAGVDPRTGIPRWSREQAKAKPLALDGLVGGSPIEEQPLVNQFTISWVGGTIRKSPSHY